MIVSNHTVDVYGMTGSGLKREYTTVVALGVAIYIYDNDESVLTVDGVIGMQETRGITNEMSITEGHKLIDEDGKIYFVKKARVKKSPIYTHLELVLSADYGVTLGS